jgi:hypothetical protein
MDETLNLCREPGCLMISDSPKRSCGSWRARLGLVASLLRSYQGRTSGESGPTVPGHAREALLWKIARLRYGRDSAYHTMRSGKPVMAAVI